MTQCEVRVLQPERRRSLTGHWPLTVTDGFYDKMLRTVTVQCGVFLDGKTVPMGSLPHGVIFFKTANHPVSLQRVADSVDYCLFHVFLSLTIGYGFYNKVKIKLFLGSKNMPPLSITDSHIWVKRKIHPILLVLLFVVLLIGTIFMWVAHLLKKMEQFYLDTKIITGPWKKFIKIALVLFSVVSNLMR